MKKVPYLYFKKTVPVGRHFHVVRHTFKPRGSFYRHGHHDFCEVFWVESGMGRHHVNGRVQELQPGMVVMVRQSDVHAIATHKGEPLTVVNFSFPTTAIKGWQRRYFLDKPVFFWSRKQLPYTQTLDAAALQRLQKWTEHLSTCPDEAFHFDWFLLDLFHALQADETFGKESEGLPERLERAVREIRERGNFLGGVHRLAELAGCSLQHLNRLFKKHGSKPAGEIVTEARLRHAARQLQLTDRKIIDIGLDVGFNNLGHFYVQFKRQYGLTPRQFRIRQQLVIGQH